MPNFDFNPKHALIASFFLLIATYSFFQGRFLIFGPQISITSPKDGYEVASPIVIVEGKAKNIAWITLNGRQIFTNEEGYWSEKLLVSEGVSIMSVKARDRFGRETKEELSIVLN